MKRLGSFVVALFLAACTASVSTPPMVAQQTGAVLVGSTSTANIGRGYGLPENRIRVAREGETIKFGRFNVTFLKSAHLPNGYAVGEIEAPLSPPANAMDYKVGESY